MKFKTFFVGAILGAAAGLLFAPDSGRRSRAVVKDKAVKYSKGAADYVDKKSRHIANKAKDYAHGFKGMCGWLESRNGEEIEEEILVEG